MARFSMAMALGCFAVVGAAPAQSVSVQAVQYPAWLERGGRSVPLAPGTVLQREDLVRTGMNARVQLGLSEGSTVKLGENARFVVERADDRRAFRASFAVIAGAFRFTTHALRRAQARDVAIKVRNVSVGIRGTDVWGKSTDERDIVCLIEGKVTVGAASHPTVTLDRPLAFYEKPRAADPKVSTIDAKQLALWSEETEIAREAGEPQAKGPWRVVAAHAADRDSALLLQRRLRAAGYPAEIAASEPYAQVHIPHLESEVHARAVMGNLRAIPGVTLPKVEPMR